MNFHIETYGCQMNAHDSEKIKGILQDIGHTSTDKQDADLLLFNTCCVREHAEKKVFGNIGALKKRKDEEPSLRIGVCGCMMQQQDVAKRLMKRFPYVDFTIGTHNLHKLPDVMRMIGEGQRVIMTDDGGEEIIEGLPISRGGNVSASVNIMYGCNNYCSYCIVPYVRGKERSRAMDNILEETRTLAAQGYSEIMLLGQNVNSYGGGMEGASFPELLRRIGEIEGLRRIRFMTSHPKDLSDELIEVMAENDRICRHLHLPVQAGNDRVLKLMNRGYTTADYMHIVNKLRHAIPEIELTTDIIVGFPGETEEAFSDTLRFVDTVGYAAAFTFMYSPRSGTRAAEMEGQLSQEAKKERLLRLNALQAQKTKETNARYIGAHGEVLIEGYDSRGEPGMLYGKLSCAKMIYFPGTKDKTGTYTRVKILRASKNSLIGVEADGKE